MRKKMVFYILTNLNNDELRHFKSVKFKWVKGFDYIINPNKVKVIIRDEEITIVGLGILRKYLRENKLKACKSNINWLLNYLN